MLGIARFLSSLILHVPLTFTVGRCIERKHSVLLISCQPLAASSASLATSCKRHVLTDVLIVDASIVIYILVLSKVLDSESKTIATMVLLSPSMPCHLPLVLYELSCNAFLDGIYPF